MNPIHFQFVTRPPYWDRYSLKSLFELLDNFDETHRHNVLTPAYWAVNPKDRQESQAATKDEVYRLFKETFAKKPLSDCAEGGVSWREAYSVYSLVCYVLSESLRKSDGDVYRNFRYNNRDKLAQFKDAVHGDDGARQRAMEWSLKVLNQLEQNHTVVYSNWLAYKEFCRAVVAPLITDSEWASEPTD